MFGSRFGHLRFSLRSDSAREFAITVNFRANLENLTGFGLITPVEFRAFDGLRGTAELFPTIPLAFTAQDELKCEAQLIGGIVISFTGASKLHNKTDVVKDIHPKESFRGTLLFKGYLGKDIHNTERFFEELKNHTNVVKDLVVSHVLTDILNAKISTAILEEITFIADVTIPPGGTLEIHSDTYDLFLNGKNILYLQRGDWIFLDRETVSLEVDSGMGGALDGRILYNERYL